MSPFSFLLAFGLLIWIQLSSSCFQRTSFPPCSLPEHNSATEFSLTTHLSHSSNTRWTSVDCPYHSHLVIKIHKEKNSSILYFVVPCAFPSKLSQA